MAIKTYSIDDEIADKFAEQTPEQETSAVLEQLMRDYLDENPDQDIVLDLKNTGLTDSQEEMVHAMVKDNVSSIGSTQLFSKAKKYNVYGRSHHFGDGISAIVSSEKIPYSKEDDKFVSENVPCGGCGQGFPINVLVDNDGVCPKCDTKTVRLPED